MKVLIIYVTRYGATEKAVKKLAEYIRQEVKIVNLREENIKNLDYYDTIVIGGSIYAGKIQKKIKDFCLGNKETLIKKKVGLFICCGDSEKVDEQLNNSFEEELLDYAIAKGYFGYEYNFENMNFFFRMIIKKIAKVKESKSEIMENNIKEFADELIGRH